MTPAMFFLSVYQMIKAQEEYDNLIKILAEENRNCTKEERRMIDKLIYLKRIIRAEVFSKDEKTGKFKHELAQTKVTSEFLNKLGCELDQEYINDLKNE